MINWLAVDQLIDDSVGMGTVVCLLSSMLPHWSSQPPCYVTMENPLQFQFPYL